RRGGAGAEHVAADRPAAPRVGLRQGRRPQPPRPGRPDLRPPRRPAHVRRRAPRRRRLVRRLLMATDPLRASRDPIFGVPIRTEPQQSHAPERGLRASSGCMLTMSAAAAARQAREFATPPNATGERPMSASPTIVLIHGAFADSASWAAVTARLLDEGYT